MRVTVTELPHEPRALAAAWEALCRHTEGHRSELVLLPEFAMLDPVWERGLFDPAHWAATEALADHWVHRLPELGAALVVGTRPMSVNGQRYNEGFLWSADGEVTPLRRKFFLPDEPGAWEAHWFDQGDHAFPVFHAGALSFGLNICTELWALESYAEYAARSVQMILSPRATAMGTTAKWLSAGVVAAVRSGAYSVSSNRVDPSGAGGGAGWIIDPDGRVLALTTPHSPFMTAEIDLQLALAARDGYPRYVFAGEGAAHPAGE